MRASLELKVPPLAQVAVFAGLMWLAAAGALVAAAGVVAFRPRPHDRRSAGSTQIDGTRHHRHLPRQPQPDVRRLPAGAGGLGLFLGNVLALAALPLFVAAMNRLQIVPEERALRARFGESFTRYERSVRRWL